MPQLYSSAPALLANVIDYAGTFPPASLSLPESLKQVAQFRRNAKHPWLLGKVALTIKDLNTLSSKDFFTAGADGAPWEFTALGSQTEAEGDFFSTLAGDLTFVKKFNQTGESATCRRQITSYENKLPAALLAPGHGGPVADFGLRWLKSFRENLGTGRVFPYLEIPFSGNWRAVTEDLGELFSDPLRSRSGIKIRTGGAYTPTLGELAFIIQATEEYKIKFKATQGLHHALTGKSGLGFVNLFAALNLRFIYGDEFDLTEMANCLSDEKAKNFTFGADDFTWDRFRATLAQLELARSQHAGCFGSCSLDEPDLFLANEILF